MKIDHTPDEAVTKSITIDRDLAEDCKGFCEYYRLPFSSLVMNALREYFFTMEKKGYITLPEPDGVPRKPTKKK